MAGIAGVTRKGGRLHYLSTIARDTVTRWDWLPDLEVLVGGTTSVDVTEPGTSMTGQQSDERPWGSYVVLGGGDGYQVKKIVVKTKRRLSYQRHAHRSEHWSAATQQHRFDCRGGGTG
jgi:hypothetical protein